MSVTTIEEYADLIQKVNKFLVVLNNLSLDVPEPRKSAAIRIQRGLIKTPLYGAEFLSKLFIRSRQKLEKYFKNIENSVEEHIAFQGFESVRKTILSTPSFFTSDQDNKGEEGENGKERVKKRTNQEKKPVSTAAQSFFDKIHGFEEAVKSTEKRELGKLYAEILNTPKEIIIALNLVAEKELKEPQNHPKTLYYDLKKGKRAIVDKEGNLIEQDLTVDRNGKPLDQDLIDALGEAIEKHEIIASLINMEFSYWRRFSALNLGTIKSVMERMKPEVLRAITFDETQMVPSLIDFKEVAEPQITELNTFVENAIKTTFLTGFHQWIIGTDNAMGRILSDLKVDSAFTSYNRGLINSRSKEEVNATVPRSAYALLNTGDSGKLKVTLKSYGEHGNSRYDDYHATMLECWIESKGIVSETKRLWKNALKDSKYDEKKHLSFDDLLSRVYTLPCILVPSKISESKTINDLQQELTQKTNELRSQFVTASMLITYGVNENGDFAITSSCDHSNWDGKQSGDLVEKIVTQVIEEIKKKKLDLNQDAELNKEEKEDHINVDIITSSVADQEELKKEGYHQIQSYVKAEGLVRICDDIGNMVRALADEGRISPDSKLKNPAVVMQLILINQYREILTQIAKDSGTTAFSPTESIGMLLGNPDITKDLDLAPIKEGFDFNLFLKLNKEQQKKYLLNQALLFDIASEHSSMRLIKQVAKYVPYPRAQEGLNAASRIGLLRPGLGDFAGLNMMSNFGLPRIKDGEILTEKNNGYQVIRNSGPANTDFQNGSMTIVGAVKIKGIFYLSICYKNRSNAAAVAIAEKFKEHIEKYDYKSWLTEQSQKE